MNDKITNNNKKNLSKCFHCSCSFSPYIKKGHTYIRPNNAKTNCKYCKNINENKVLSQLKKLFKIFQCFIGILF